MGKYIEPEVLLTERTTATASPSVWKLYSDLSDEYDESTGLGTFVYADATVDEAINFGTIAKAKLILIKSDQDISLKLNGGVESTPKFKFFVMVADETTGVTSMSISNDSGSAATVERLIAGDVST